MRTCIKCGESKKDTCFYKRKDRESGFFNTCKDCYSAWRKEHYQHEIDRVKSYEASRRELPSRRFQKLKCRAKKKNIPLSITLDQFELLIQNPCFYCSNKLGNPVIAGIGLDRLDSNLGYEMENVVSCCTFCNTIKMDNLSKEEMIKVAELLIQMRITL